MNFFSAFSLLHICEPFFVFFLHSFAKIVSVISSRFFPIVFYFMRVFSGGTLTFYLFVKFLMRISQVCRAISLTNSFRLHVFFCNFSYAQTFFHKLFCNFFLLSSFRLSIFFVCELFPCDVSRWRTLQILFASFSC